MTSACKELHQCLSLEMPPTCTVLSAPAMDPMSFWMARLARSMLQLTGITEFQQILFASTGLPGNAHNLVLTYAGIGTGMTVDSIMFKRVTSHFLPRDQKSCSYSSYSNVKPTDSTDSSTDDLSSLITPSPSIFDWIAACFTASLRFNIAVRPVSIVLTFLLCLVPRHLVPHDYREHRRQ